MAEPPKWVSYISEAEMFECKVQDTVLEYNRIFKVELAYISLNLRNQAACISTRSIEKEIYYAKLPLVLDK